MDQNFTEFAAAIVKKNILFEPYNTRSMVECFFDYAVNEDQPMHVFEGIGLIIAERSRISRQQQTDEIDPVRKDPEWARHEDVYTSILDMRYVKDHLNLPQDTNEAARLDLGNDNNLIRFAYWLSQGHFGEEATAEALDRYIAEQEATLDPTIIEQIRNPEFDPHAPQGHEITVKAGDLQSEYDEQEFPDMTSFIQRIDAAANMDSATATDILEAGYNVMIDMAQQHYHKHNVLSGKARSEYTFSEQEWGALQATHVFLKIVERRTGTAGMTVITGEVTPVEMMLYAFTKAVEIEGRPSSKNVLAQIISENETRTRQARNDITPKGGNGGDDIYRAPSM